MGTDVNVMNLGSAASPTAASGNAAKATAVSDASAADASFGVQLAQAQAHTDAAAVQTQAPATACKTSKPTVTKCNDKNTDNAKATTEPGSDAAAAQGVALEQAQQAMPAPTAQPPALTEEEMAALQEFVADQGQPPSQVAATTPKADQPSVVGQLTPAKPVDASATDAAQTATPSQAKGQVAVSTPKADVDVAAVLSDNLQTAATEPTAQTTPTTTNGEAPRPAHTSVDSTAQASAQAENVVAQASTNAEAVKLAASQPATELISTPAEAKAPEAQASDKAATATADATVVEPKSQPQTQAQTQQQGNPQQAPQDHNSTSDAPAPATHNAAAAHIRPAFAATAEAQQATKDSKPTTQGPQQAKPDASQPVHAHEGSRMAPAQTHVQPSLGQAPAHAEEGPRLANDAGADTLAAKAQPGNATASANASLPASPSATDTTVADASSSSPAIEAATAPPAPPAPPAESATLTQVFENALSRDPEVQDAFHAALANRVAQAAREYLQAGTSDFRIRLNPPELGEMRLHFRMDGDRVSAEVAVTRPEAAQAVLEHVEQLRQSLARVGVDLGSMTAREQSPSPQGQPQRGQHDGAFDWQQWQDEFGLDSDPDDVQDDGIAPHPRLLANWRSSLMSNQSRLNVVA